MNTDDLQNVLEYKFRNVELLSESLTHSSYANETGSKSNERLEFLGDSVLGFTVAEYLFQDCAMDEGELTKKRASMVSEQPLSAIALSLNLDKYILKKQSVQASKAVLCDLLEAVIGAIFIDGGMDAARRFITEKVIKPLFCDKRLTDEEFTDYKSRLVEYCVKNNLKLDYVLISVSGEEHAPTYRYKVEINGKNVGEGSGSSKKDAQQIASKRALDKVKAGELL